MYYVKIPLRFLSRPEELNVEPERKQEAWDARVESLLSDIRNGIIPSWAINHRDLELIKVESDEAA